MTVLAGEDAALTFDTTTPKRYRVSDETGLIQDWQDAVSASLTVPGSLNTLSDGQPTRTMIVTLDDGQGLKFQTYVIVSQEPLVVMQNSFMTLEQALAKASGNFFTSTLVEADMDDIILSLTQAFDVIVGMNFYIVREYDDCDKNRAGYNLPDYDVGGITDFRSYTASDFSSLEPAFQEAIKKAQLLGAVSLISQRDLASSESANPRQDDPDLLMEKIGDTSRTWTARRSVNTTIGSRAMRAIAGYVWSPLKTTRI